MSLSSESSSVGRRRMGLETKQEGSAPGGGSLGGEKEVVVEGASKGLSYGTAAYFIIANIAGAGFLSLPRALADAGWVGLFMMLVFCVGLGFSGERLGVCWVILEERWPEYRLGCRQPYMEIAYRSFGVAGRRLANACVVITLMGGTTVYIVLMAQFINALEPKHSGLYLCEWVLIVGVVVMPLTWLGTPKDFWQASVVAVVATAVACVVVFVKLLIEIEPTDNPSYPNPTVASFSVAFGAILFAFNGAAVFPTIQNDMADKKLFSKSIAIGFAVILSLYLPVAVAGYATQGGEVESNILLSVQNNWAIKVAIVMEVINLLGTYVIVFNPVAQNFEDLLNIPGKFGIKRVVMRSSIVILETVICLAIPDFSLILNLIGGSTVAISAIILPPLMYMKLADARPGKEDLEWPVRTISLWERILHWELIFVGVVGGIISTIAAIYAIVDPDALGSSCFTNFSQD